MSKSVSFAIWKKSCTFAQNFENNLYVDQRTNMQYRGFMPGQVRDRLHGNELPCV